MSRPLTASQKRFFMQLQREVHNLKSGLLKISQQIELGGKTFEQLELRLRAGENSREIFTKRELLREENKRLNAQKMEFEKKLAFINKQYVYYQQQIQQAQAQAQFQQQKMLQKQQQMLQLQMHKQVASEQHQLQLLLQQEQLQQRQKMYQQQQQQQQQILYPSQVQQLTKGQLVPQLASPTPSTTVPASPSFSFPAAATLQFQAPNVQNESFINTSELLGGQAHLSSSFHLLQPNILSPFLSNFSAATSPSFSEGKPAANVLGHLDFGGNVNLDELENALLNNNLGEIRPVDLKNTVDNNVATNKNITAVSTTSSSDIVITNFAAHDNISSSNSSNNVNLSKSGILNMSFLSNPTSQNLNVKQSPAEASNLNEFKSSDVRTTNIKKGTISTMDKQDNIQYNSKQVHKTHKHNNNSHSNSTKSQLRSEVDTTPLNKTQSKLPERKRKQTFQSQTDSKREPSIISNASPDSTTFAGSSKLGTESSKPSESSNFLGTDPVTTSGFLHNMTGIVHGSEQKSGTANTSFMSGVQTCFTELSPLEESPQPPTATLPSTSLSGISTPQTTQDSLSTQSRSENYTTANLHASSKDNDNKGSHNAFKRSTTPVLFPRSRGRPGNLINKDSFSKLKMKKEKSLLSPAAPVSSNIVAPVITPSTNLEPMRSIYTSSNFETLTPRPLIVPEIKQPKSSYLHSLNFSDNTVKQKEQLLLDKKLLNDLILQIDPRLKLDEDIEDLLLEFAEEFVSDAVRFSCQLSKHRNSQALEAKDIQLYLVYH
ncbi:putative mediator of RNA polymerase II transcription subunit 26 isoform X2 [Zophobas morio]|uniref:putative mediator of RNA polymerase II transcription subunit 26 isoform X2 n=1 Tax=Zophobas morio TaxID=2755281 RepID=UPI003083A963